MPEKVIIKAKKLLAMEITLAKINEDSTFVNDFNDGFSNGDFSEPFEYTNAPEKPREKSKSSSYVYPRSKKVAFNALKKAEFLCEIDSTHNVFVRKSSKTTYTEPHHLIPLSAQSDFPDANLDREQNVVSLCSHCHNLLHYGKDYEQILLMLFNQRKELLNKIGISITYEQLKSYYI